MWSSRRVLREFATLLIAAPLGGCFHPMYGGVAGRALVGNMRAVQVEPIQGRLGHYLHNELIFGLNGSGGSYDPRFRLVVTPLEKVETPLVDTISGRATAGTVVVDAPYRLERIKDGKLVASGTAFTAASYDRTSQRFADIRAARDAELRDARSLADQIQIRIAAALSTGSG